MLPSRLRRAVVMTVILLGMVLLPPPPRLSANVIYPTLPPGAEYQLLLVTSGGTDATSTSIADYNAFVTAQAALNPSLPAGVTWSAVASTALVDALNNAPNPPGVPVYNTAGILLCSGTYGLYGTIPLLAAPSYDENGSLLDTAVWTGSSYGGVAVEPLGGPSGSESVILGFSDNARTWLGATVADPGNFLSLYALSSPITVPVPEPWRWRCLVRASWRWLPRDSVAR